MRVFCSTVVVLSSISSAGSAVVLCSALVLCSAGFASVPISTWTCPSVPPPVAPPLHHPPGLIKLEASGSCSLGGDYVTNPACPSVHSPLLVTHTTQTVALTLDSSSQDTPHPNLMLTCSQSRSLHKPWTSFLSLPSIVYITLLVIATLLPVSYQFRSSLCFEHVLQ